jgi:hypothetical protein
VHAELRALVYKPSKRRTSSTSCSRMGAAGLLDARDQNPPQFIVWHQGSSAYSNQADFPKLGVFPNCSRTYVESITGFVYG